MDDMALDRWLLVISTTVPLRKRVDLLVTLVGWMRYQRREADSGGGLYRRGLVYVWVCSGKEGRDVMTCWVDYGYQPSRCYRRRVRCEAFVAVYIKEEKYKDREREISVKESERRDWRRAGISSMRDNPLNPAALLQTNDNGSFLGPVCAAPPCDTRGSLIDLRYGTLDPSPLEVILRFYQLIALERKVRQDGICMTSRQIWWLRSKLSGWNEIGFKLFRMSCWCFYCFDTGEKSIVEKGSV